MGSQCFHHLADPDGFIQHRAQFLLEGQRAEFLQQVRQFVFEVFVDEEIGVRETGADDLLVAVGDQVKTLFVSIAHRHEMRQQFAVLAQNREVTLMFLHYRDEHLRRQDQVFFLKGTQKRGGGFHQLIDLIQQVFVDLFLSVHFGKQFGNLSADGCLAFVGVKQDALRFQFREILRGIFHRHYLRFDKAQSVGCGSGSQTGILKGDGRRTEHGQQPAYRA